MNVALQSLLLALITGLGPVVAIFVTGRQRRNETHDGWKRDDIERAQAKTDARELREQLAESQRVLAEEAHGTSLRLDVVHKLVNNTLTIEKERALILTRQSLATAQVNVVLLGELGRSEEAEKLGGQIRQLEASVSVLEDELADRARQVESATPEITEAERHPNQM